MIRTFPSRQPFLALNDMSRQPIDGLPRNLFGPRVHGAQMMTPNGFSGPLTFTRVQQAGKRLHISS